MGEHLSPEPSAKIVKRGIPVWVLVVTLLVVATAAGVGAWYLASRPADDVLVIEDATAEPEAEAADTPVVTAEEPKPSFVRYAYVRAVTGSAGDWEASLDSSTS